MVPNLKSLKRLTMLIWIILQKESVSISISSRHSASSQMSLQQFRVSYSAYIPPVSFLILVYRYILSSKNTTIQELLVNKKKSVTGK